MPNATRNFMLHLLLVFPNYNLAKCITYYTTFHQMKKWCSLKQDVAFLPCDKESKYPGGGGSLCVQASVPGSARDECRMQGESQDTCSVPTEAIS